MKQLDPKSQIWFFLSNLLASVFLMFVLFLLFLTTISYRTDVLDFVNDHIGWIIIFFIAGFLLLVILSYVIAYLTYKFYKYELTDECFKKEQGIIWKKYVYIPYEKIQNVDINRGPLDRILGLSNISIQTAGYSGVNSGGASSLSEGYLPGVSKDEGEFLRDELIKRSQIRRAQMNKFSF